jgi:hypothetical protein
MNKETAILILSQNLKKYGDVIIKLSIKEKIFSKGLKGFIHILGVSNGLKLISEMPDYGWNVIDYKTYDKTFYYNGHYDTYHYVKISLDIK